jgi:LPXTG-site transpeptidase (sortase) family protein
MKRQVKSKISAFWIDVIRVTLLILLAILAINWGYFVKQVSSWVDDLVPDNQSAEEVMLTAPDRLAIPSLKIEAPLIRVTATDEPTLQHGLEQGVVHYPDTAEPGEFGNAYYFGHSSDYAFKGGKYKTVFATLPKIAEGEKIYITDQKGKQFVYQVVEKKIVGPHDVEVLSQGEGKEKLLTLQTSWPLGTALKRYLVVAELVK